MFLLWKYFALGFSALLPVVNPLGSALVFLGLVGISPPHIYRALARRIALNTVIFFAVIELIGSALLGFFVECPIFCTGWSVSVAQRVL